MAGAIKGVKEHVEEQVGMVLRTRNQIVVQLARRPGLGPPDLVWLSKTDRLTVEGVCADSQLPQNLSQQCSPYRGALDS